MQLLYTVQYLSFTLAINILKNVKTKILLYKNTSSFKLGLLNESKTGQKFQKIATEMLESKRGFCLALRVLQEVRQC